MGLARRYVAGLRRDRGRRRRAVRRLPENVVRVPTHPSWPHHAAAPSRPVPRSDTGRTMLSNAGRPSPAVLIIAHTLGRCRTNWPFGATWRPHNPQGHRPTLAFPWQPPPYQSSVELRRLSEPDTERLIAEWKVSRELPPALRDAVVARTDGVPLFVEELARAVLESDLIGRAFKEKPCRIKSCQDADSSAQNANRYGNEALRSHRPVPAGGGVRWKWWEL